MASVLFCRNTDVSLSPPAQDNVVVHKTKTTNTQNLHLQYNKNLFHKYKYFIKLTVLGFLFYLEKANPNPNSNPNQQPNISIICGFMTVLMVNSSSFIAAADLCPEPLQKKEKRKYRQGTHYWK